MADLFDDLKIDPAGNSGSKQASTDLFDDLGINPTPKQNTSLIGDLGTDFKRGLQQIPGAATGVVDLVVGGLTGERYASKAADALGEATGFQPGKWAEEARAEYSPQRQAAEAEIDQAWEEGTATDIAGAYLRNPGRVAGLVAESLPSMVAGGLAGRAGLAAGRASGALARPATAAQAARQAVAGGAAGEGAVIAGQTMGQIDDSVDARRAAAAAAGAGALGGALGYAGGRVAQRMGLADAETMIAGGARPAGDAPPRGLVQRMLGGAMSEGAFEELPQSVQEQMWQNWAEGNPLMEGVARSAVEGTLAGSAMGAAANVMPARRGADGNGQAGQQRDSEVAGLLPAPVSTGTPNEQILQAEVERENEVAAAEARAAEIYRQRAEFDAQRPAAPRPSEQMGLDPNAGPMSAAAALAVDSGALQPAMDQRQAVERVRDQVPPPAGSFSAMNEFADLLEQEGQDVASRRDRIADVQSQRREFEFEEADRRTAEAMQFEAQARRRDVLDAVLEDPDTANPAERFAAMLGRLGFRESAPTAEELQTIRRFQDVRAAQPATPEIEPSAPNELDAEAVGIRERRPKALQAAANREPSATAPTTQPAEDQPASAALTREAGQVNETPVSLTNADSRWASMSTADRQAAAERAGLNPIQRRNVPDRPWRQLSANLQERLVQAMGSFQNPVADDQIEGISNGAIPAQRTDAAVAAPGAAQAGADVAGSAGNAPARTDVPAAGELEPAARGPVAGGRTDQLAGDASAGRAAVRPGDGSPVGQALSVLLDRTDGNGSPDGLSGPEHADARTAIVAAITGQSAAEIEAAPNFKFRTSVPQVERLLYDAVGVPAAGNLKDRRGPFLDWLDGATGQQAAAVEATGEVVSERDGDGDPQFSFAGQQAQTADRMSLDTARQRIEAGEDAETVRQETGWHRGADGKWRFEISDADARLGRAFMEQTLDKDDIQNVRLPGVLWHNALYAAYPGLRDIRVNWKRSDNERGTYLPADRTINIEAPTLKETLSILLHEVQHGIQRIEGFATGGSPAGMRNYALNESRRIIEAEFSHLPSYQQARENGSLDEWVMGMVEATGQGVTPADAYRRLAGEAEARNTEARQRMTDAERRATPPSQTADVPDSDVIVTFNGKEMASAPMPANAAMVLPEQPTRATSRRRAPKIDEAGLIRAMELQFPSLVKPVRQMLDRGKQGQRGGLVLIDSANPEKIAQAFSSTTGRSMDSAVEAIGEHGAILGFFDPRSGMTFMVGPRLNPVTAPAVLLHEAMHGKQRAAIDAKALSLIENRRRQPARPLRQFLDGVAARMEDAGEAGNAIEASTYIVEQAVIAGRQAGFSAVDGRLLNWIDANIGKQVGNLVREFVAMIRAWGLRLNAGVVTRTVDDLVALAQLNLRDMGRGDVVGRGSRAAASLSAERTPKLRAATNFLQARQAAREFQGKELTNSATGMTAVVSRNSLDKMLSGKAVSKSETPATHAMAVANADKLFEHAVLGWSKPDRASDPSIVAIHRFFAPMDVGGRTKLVKLTVKETAQASDANPLYTVEAVEFNENMPGREWLEAAAQEDGVSLETENPLQRGVGGREGQRADPRPTLAQPRGNAPGRSAEDVLSLVLSSDASKAANDTLAATQRRADSSDASMGAGDSSNVPSPPGNNKPRDDGDGDIRFSRAGRAIDAAGAAIDRARDVKRKITGKDAGPTAAQTFNDLDAEQQQYLGKIGSRRAPAADAIRSALDRAALKIRQGMVDRYAALKELDEKLHGKDFINSSITDSSWVLAKMSSAASGALNAMMSTGRIVFDGAQRAIAMKDGDATGGLTAVLHQLGSPAEVERFFGWVAANRAEKLMAEGREHLFSPEEIAAGKRMNAGKTAEGKVRPMLYAKVFKEFQQYRDDVLAIAEQTGTISEENRAMWRDEFYVPFYRVMEEEGGAKGPRAGKGLSRQEAYKKLKGGRENLNDLLENTLMNFHHLLSASLKNQAAAQAIKNAEKLGIARKVPESNRDTDTSTFVLEKGRRVFYQVDDPLVFEAITSLSDPGLNNFAVRAMSAFKRTFTNMTTITPQFVIANTLRDLMQATATSPVSKNALKNVAQGLKTFTNDKTRAEMLASGGAFSFGHIYGMDADEVRASLRQTVKGAQLVSDPSMIPQILRQGWRKWNQITDVSENMTRAATYAQNVEEMGRLRAAFEARDVMDFSQHGAWPAVRFLIRVVPFLNARLQGLDKLYRSGVRPALMTAMGKGTASDKQAAARFATVTGALTLASLALYMANADDDEYQKLEEWQKDTYWFFRIGDNAFFLPKPFEVGSIATMAERAAQQFMDDKATGKLFRERMWEMLMQAFAFNPTPQVFQPVIDVYSNKDAFTGRDIETAGMDRLSVGLRARDTTTAAGRAISAASRVFGDETPLAVSPVQADHLIRGYLGSVGATGAGMIDTIWRTATGQEAPDRRWSEYQPIRRFYRDLGAPAPYTRYSTLFYEGLRESNRIYADVMELQKLGRGEDAGALREKHRNVLAMRQTLNREQRRLGDINQQMQAVRRSDRDGEWKRREIDRLNTLKNAITERQGRRIDEVRAAE